MQYNAKSQYNKKARQSNFGHTNLVPSILGELNSVKIIMCYIFIIKYEYNDIAFVKVILSETQVGYYLIYLLTNNVYYYKLFLFIK